MKYTLIKDNEQPIVFDVYDAEVWINGDILTHVDARERWKDYLRAGYTYDKQPPRQTADTNLKGILHPFAPIKSRKLKLNWSVEAANDLKKLSEQNDDELKTQIDMMSKEIAKEVSKKVSDELLK
jgi:hypothetical protein